MEQDALLLQTKRRASGSESAGRIRLSAGRSPGPDPEEGELTPARTPVVSHPRVQFASGDGNGKKSDSSAGQLSVRSLPLHLRHNYYQLFRTPQI